MIREVNAASRRTRRGIGPWSKIRSRGRWSSFEKSKLPAMIERAGYPGVAADRDVEKIASVFPAMKKQALAMWEEGQRLTGHPGLPLEPTPNHAHPGMGLSAWFLVTRRATSSPVT
jgi:hypothetical protein